MHRLASALALLVCPGLRPMSPSNPAQDWIADVCILADDGPEGGDTGSEGHFRPCVRAATA
jgi:hypothetical protein